MHNEVDLRELPVLSDDTKELYRLLKLNNLNYTLKYDHIVHYPQLIREFGPLYNYNTLRFERAHQVEKGSLRASRNTKNIAFSVGKSYCKITDKIISSKNEETVLKDNNSVEIDSIYHQFIDLNSDLDLIEETYVEKTKLQIGSYYIYEWKDQNRNNLPTFFYIVIIIKQNDSIKILGHIVLVDKFNSKFYSYKISNQDSRWNQVIVLNRKIPYYRKLNYIQFENDHYIMKDFHIVNYC